MRKLILSVVLLVSPLMLTGCEYVGLFDSSIKPEVTGEGPKSIAEVQFEQAGRKRLLIKIAPIEKL